ncbi:MAG: hypothetical protein WKF47_03320 [Geodermatophilaceae bacterium]
MRDGNVVVVKGDLVIVDQDDTVAAATGKLAVPSIAPGVCSPLSRTVTPSWASTV